MADRARDFHRCRKISAVPKNPFVTLVVEIHVFMFKPFAGPPNATCGKPIGFRLSCLPKLNRVNYHVQPACSLQLHTRETEEYRRNR